VSGEAAAREQAPTGADWPGFYLSAGCSAWITVAQARNAAGENRTGMGMIRQEGERVIHIGAGRAAKGL